MARWRSENATERAEGSDAILRGWRAWYQRNAPYLYRGVDPLHIVDGRPGEEHILIDFEAKCAGVPQQVYRQTHRRIGYHEVSAWQDTPEYLAALRAFCLSLLIADASRVHPETSMAVVELACIDDPLARNAVSIVRSEFGKHSYLEWAMERVDAMQKSRTEEELPHSPPSDTALAAWRASLQDEDPITRVDSAARLCERGGREGTPVLLDALELRPLTGSNLDAVRRACEALGKLGERTAVEPLRRLLRENLNGSLPGVYGEGARYRRPDAVALARLGQEEGYRYLEQSIQEGDPYWVLGIFPDESDVEELMDRRFLPLLVPLLASTRIGTRETAARTIIRLLDEGR